MNKPELTPAQKAVLDRMEEGEWLSSNQLQCSVATLNALNKKGYVKSKNFANNIVDAYRHYRHNLKFQKIKDYK
jgi:hypothetical protein